MTVEAYAGVPQSEAYREAFERRLDKSQGREPGTSTALRKAAEAEAESGDVVQIGFAVGAGIALGWFAGRMIGLPLLGAAAGGVGGYALRDGLPE